MAKDKRPSMQFYPGDWMKDPDLRRCSHAAKGVWVDLLCLMFECAERGVLATSGVAWTDQEIAQAVGGDQSVVLECLRELTCKGVAKRRADGALYSKRMVADETKRRLCSEAGKRGGNPLLVETLKGHPKGGAKGGSKRNPTPSSSTSSSLSPSLSGGESEKRFPLSGRWNVPRVHEALNLWARHYAAKRPGMTFTDMEAVMVCKNADSSGWEPDRLVRAIEFSILKGAKNIIEDDGLNKTRRSPDKPVQASEPPEPVKPVPRRIAGGGWTR